jgi:hypothetical protein
MVLEAGAYRSDRMMLVQDATAEERDSYSDTTQADPEAEAAATALEAEEEVGASVVSATAPAEELLTASVTATADEVLATGRTLLSRVVLEAAGVSTGTTKPALDAEAVGTTLDVAGLV